MLIINPLWNLDDANDIIYGKIHYKMWVGNYASVKYC